MANSSSDKRLLIELRPLKRDKKFAFFGALWIFVSWLLATELILPLLFSGLISLGIPLREWAQGSLLLLLILNYSYAPITLGLIWVLFTPYLHRQAERIRDFIALSRWPDLRDVAYALPAFALYFVASAVLAYIVVNLVSSVDLNQAQNLGISAPTTVVAYVLTFVMLVVLPPFIEEVLFRGFLFGTLRRGFPWIVSAVVTSILFGVAHGQVNLFLDTLALSLVLCYLREKTGSLWAGIFLHALKNSIAFVLLYIVGVK